MDVGGNANVDVKDVSGNKNGEYVVKTMRSLILESGIVALFFVFGFVVCLCAVSYSVDRQNADIS